MVHVVQIRTHLGTKPATRDRVVRVAMKRDRFTVAHFGNNPAGIGTVVGTGAADVEGRHNALRGTEDLQVHLIERDMDSTFSEPRSRPGLRYAEASATIRGFAHMLDCKLLTFSAGEDAMTTSWLRVPIYLAALLVLLPAGIGNGQDRYQKPPQVVLDVLNVPPAPIALVSPTNDRLLLAQAVAYPPIADLAEPMLRLAGQRINPRTNGPHRSPRIGALTLITIADGKAQQVELPPNARLGLPTWSPDGQRFAFTQTMDNGIELLVGIAKTGVCSACRVSPSMPPWGTPSSGCRTATRCWCIPSSRDGASRPLRSVCRMGQ